MAAKRKASPVITGEPLAKRAAIFADLRVVVGDEIVHTSRHYVAKHSPVMLLALCSLDFEEVAPGGRFSTLEVPADSPGFPVGPLAYFRGGVQTDLPRILPLAQYMEFVQDARVEDLYAVLAKYYERSGVRDASGAVGEPTCLDLGGVYRLNSPALRKACEDAMWEGRVPINLTLGAPCDTMDELVANLVRRRWPAEIDDLSTLEAFRYLAFVAPYHHAGCAAETLLIEKGRRLPGSGKTNGKDARVTAVEFATLVASQDLCGADKDRVVSALRASAWYARAFVCAYRRRRKRVERENAKTADASTQTTAAGDGDSA